MILRKARVALAPDVISTADVTRVLGYGRYLKSKPYKRALLSYLPSPLIAELRGEQLTRFSNHGLAVSWARVLNELGYIVDCISWDDTAFEPQETYDVVVLHGAKNYEQLASRLAGNPTLVYFTTGTHWRFNNAQEETRLLELRERHGLTLPHDRYISTGEDRVYAAAKGIVALGTDYIAATYHNSPTVMNINLACYPDAHFNSRTKDYAVQRNNFVFFAGAGNVHKGLDILLDSFAGLEQQLYIVTPMESAFLKAFKRELSLPNIHLIGEVNMRTPEYYDVMDQCDFIIFPSCSEGQAGSVIEAMNQGLIPIISRETGVDVHSFGLELTDCKIDTIKQAVASMAALDAAQIKKRSKLARRTAKQRHSPEQFRKDLRQAIKTIINA
jgi:glycosyltransferase involved in cell wall biosynthesis